MGSVHRPIILRLCFRPLIVTTLVGCLLGYLIPTGVVGKNFEPWETIYNVFNVIQFAVYGALFGAVIDVVLHPPQRTRFSTNHVFGILTCVAILAFCFRLYRLAMDGHSFQLWYSCRRW